MDGHGRGSSTNHNPAMQEVIEQLKEGLQTLYGQNHPLSDLTDQQYDDLINGRGVNINE